jgi:hypothetical protein
LACFGWLLCLFGGLSALEAAVRQHPLAMLPQGMALAGGFALAWQRLRIHFDIHAFELIASDPEGAKALPNFDLALKRLGLREGSDPRNLEQRAMATRKMVTRLAQIVCMEFLLVIAGLIARYAH